MESQFGVSLNIFSHRTGTTKASGDIVSYDTKHPLSSLSVLGNFESRFSVHYHFNNQLYIGTNISLSKSIQSQILSDGIIYKPFQFSLGCVSGYEFWIKLIHWAKFYYSWSLNGVYIKGTPRLCLTLRRKCDIPLLNNTNLCCDKPSQLFTYFGIKNHI